MMWLLLWAMIISCTGVQRELVDLLSYHDELVTDGAEINSNNLSGFILVDSENVVTGYQVGTTLEDVLGYVSGKLSDAMAAMGENEKNMVSLEFGDGSILSFIVVYDLEVPVLVAGSVCPVDMSMEIGVSMSRGEMTWEVPGYEDILSGLEEGSPRAEYVASTELEDIALGDEAIGPVSLLPGSYRVAILAEDKAGNVNGDCAFDLVVTGGNGEAPKLLGCPSNMSVMAATISSADAVVNWSAPSVSDDVDTGIVPTLSTAPTAGLASGDSFPVGETTALYEAEDSHGNTSSCQFTVTVTLPIESGPGGYFMVESGNTGTPGAANNPFLIRNTNDLGNLATTVNSNISYSYGGSSWEYRSSHYLMIGDIDLGTGYVHNVIGRGSSSSDVFKGNFNGNGHRLLNFSLFVSTSNPVGFFGLLSNASISNLTIAEGVVANVGGVGNHAGTLAGKAIDSDISGVTISNMEVRGIGLYAGGGLLGIYELLSEADHELTNVIVEGGSVTNYLHSGGLIGEVVLNGSTTRSLSVRSSHTDMVVSGVGKAGGLIGDIQNMGQLATNLIEDSYAQGAVTSSGGYGGGLVGAYDGGLGGATFIIRRSVATGDVTLLGGANGGGFIGSISTCNGCWLTLAENAAAGSILGEAGQNIGGMVGNLVADGIVSITESYAVGGFQGTGNAGGFIGNHTNNSVSGGVRIAQNYSIGAHSGTGTGNIGGFSGGSSGLVQTGSSYWDTTTSGLTNSFGGTGYSSVTLKAPTTSAGIYNNSFANWSTAVWHHGSSSQYSVLKNLPGPYSVSYQLANFFP